MRGEDAGKHQQTSCSMAVIELYVAVVIVTISPPAQSAFLPLRLFCLNPQAGVRHGVETMVQSPLQQQFFVCATLDKAPLIEHDDPVSVLHRC